MGTVLDIITKEFNELKGQFVITDGWKIERFIAIATDNQDYYYVTYNGRRLLFNSCVGKVIRLKGRIDDADYAGFIRLAKLNHYDQVDLWGNNHPEKRKIEIEEHKAELLHGTGDDKFLTEVCWDLN